MRRRHNRGGIERKFVTSILWVAFIPMTLALLIGYVSAREGQQLAVIQNLSTAVQTTAGGIQLALEQQLEVLEFIAQDPALMAALKAPSEGRRPEIPPVLTRLASTPERGLSASAFTLYDANGRIVLHTPETLPIEPDIPEWFGDIQESRFVNFAYNGKTQSYYNELVAPVRSAAGEPAAGYLVERRPVDDLLRLLLDKVDEETGKLIDANSYELINLDAQFIVYLERPSEGPAPPPGYYRLDKSLADRLSANRERQFDTFYQDDYLTRGQSVNALMAYHRLDPQKSLYLLAYRDTRHVFRIINIGALLTIAVTAIVIGVLVLIAYRSVHNNVIRPVALLNEGAQIVRQGDLELKLVIDTGDEIEELAMSFNKMATALRQNISQLEASEERYRSLFDSMRDGVFQTDAEGRFTLINPAGAQVLGYRTPAEALQVTLESVFLDQGDYARVMQDLERQRFIERTRVWMKTQDDRSICVELAASRVFDDGAYVGIEGTFQDVTQNVLLEKESHERSERISAINQIANAINSSLEAGRVYESLANEVRRIVDFEYAAVALARPVSSEAGKANGLEFANRQLWPEGADGQSGALRMEGEESCAAWVTREERFLQIDDLATQGNGFKGQFPADIQSCLCVPLYASGRIIGTLNLGSSSKSAFSRHELMTLEEMSPHIAVAIRNAELLENLQATLEEATRARERLHEANEELKTLDELKTNLLSNVSHELRTPLVAVMGYTDMILNRKVGPINDVQEEYLSISLRNIEKLVSLIENLLDFSRLHRGDEDMFFDTFDLVDCVRTSIQVVQPVADSRAITVRLHVKDPLGGGEMDFGEPGADQKILVEGDKGKMGQVFINLLSNAVKFNNNGGKVDIYLDAGPDLVDVTVSDNGIGIPESEQDKIFNRFYQVDSSSTRKYGGTGIGLAIVQDIVRLHGSSISVQSREGEGTTFRFSLSLSPAHRRGKDEPAPTLPIPTETHLLIELVSQDRALSNQIRSMLLSEGMDVIHAAYSAMAVSLANKYSPDCILVDTEAGPMGSMVIDDILSDPSVGSLPIVLLTNDDDLYERVKGQIAGRVKRGFRKSTLLGGIHYALSRGLQTGEQLGNKVLCVDDDDEILRFMKRCVEGEGFEVDTCSNGEEAIRLAESGDYWMVLMDIAMPGMDGWEACATIRQNTALNGIRIYLVTAKPMEQARSRMQESGAAGYLLKPFRAEELLELFAGFEWRKRDASGPAVETV